MDTEAKAHEDHTRQFYINMREWTRKRAESQPQTSSGRSASEHSHASRIDSVADKVNLGASKWAGSDEAKNTDMEKKKDAKKLKLDDARQRIHEQKYRFMVDTIDQGLGNDFSKGAMGWKKNVREEA